MYGTRNAVFPPCIANTAVQSILHVVDDFFRRFLTKASFSIIHTPKLSEPFEGIPSCLSQAPILFMQMAINGGFKRVFEIGSIYLGDCQSEFTGLDVEMEIMEHYFELTDIVDVLFVSLFDYLNDNCSKELDIIRDQFPFRKLEYSRETLKLTYAEGIEMLQHAGIEVPPFADLSPKAAKMLGQLVFDKYGTEFFILYKYPLSVRPFYTMPCYDDPAYSNSFNVFIRGEVLVSGAQRQHDPELLAEQAKALGIDVNAIKFYLESFRYGAAPHAGFGLELERLVMLFCAL